MLIHFTLGKWLFIIVVRYGQFVILNVPYDVLSINFKFPFCHVLLFLSRPRATLMIMDDVPFVRTYCFQLIKPQPNLLQVIVNYSFMGRATSPTNVLLLISLDKFYQLFTANRHCLSLCGKLWYHFLQFLSVSTDIIHDF